MKRWAPLLKKGHKRIFAITKGLLYIVTRCVAIRFRLCWRHLDDLLVCFGAKPTQKAWGRDLSRDRKWRRAGKSQREQLTKQDRREQSAWDSCPENDTVSRMRQWEDGGRAEKRVNRSQKGDCQDLLIYRARVNQREKMSAWLVACENFVRIHAHVSTQKAKCHKVPPLALGANPSPCLFVCSFLPPSRLCFVWP